MPDTLVATPPRRPMLVERTRTYAIPCASPFRDQVMALAQARPVTTDDPPQQRL